MVTIGYRWLSGLIAFPDFFDFSSPDQTTQRGFHPLKPEADQQRQGSWSPGISHLPCSLTRRQLVLASFIGLTESALPPLNTCPGLRPRWCPVHSPYRKQDCCFPTQCTASAFTSNNLRLILMATTIHPPTIACHFMCCMDIVYWQWRAGISGLNPGPTSLSPPASDSRYRVCLRVQLLTCWLSFSQVGLSRHRVSGSPTG